MQAHDEEEIRDNLKRAFPPVDHELRRDLWPLMSRRIERPVPMIPWYDWALAVSLTCALIFFPKLTLLVAYNL
jgi:hypothetical protein